MASMQLHTHHQDARDQQFAQLLEQALQAQAIKQQTFGKIIADYTQWNIDDERCVLQLSADNRADLSFTLTPIATYLSDAQDWAWIWANDAFSTLAREKSARIKTLSASTGYAIFETAHSPAKVHEVDELCALALHALGGTAIFKVKQQSPWCLYVVE